MNCDHINTKIIPNYKKECVNCGIQFCTHPKMDYDSTCMMCGEYITEVSNEQVWIDNAFNIATSTVKSTKNHIKLLESLEYSPQIIELAMEKFTKIGCTLSEEPLVLAVCVWMAFWDIDIPRTMIEIAKKHGITKSKIKKGRQIVLSMDAFKSYKTKYVTISMMIKKLLIDLKIDDRYYSHIYDMAKYVEDNWEHSKNTRRSAPQNVASACVFLYISHSDTLKHLVSTPTKKKKICDIMGPSSITIDKIVKQLEDIFIKLK